MWLEMRTLYVILYVQCTFLTSEDKGTAMKKLILVLLLLPVAVILVMAIGFVITQTKLHLQDLPSSESSPDWPVLLEEEIPAVVTIDEDGDRRITQVWIAGVDGEPYLRTSDSRWFANLGRDPGLELRIGGVMFPCTTHVVTDEGLIARVHTAFYNKYPRRSRMFRMLGVTTPTVIGLTCEVR